MICKFPVTKTKKTADFTPDKKHRTISSEKGAG
jgi:hypothetical protein